MQHAFTKRRLNLGALLNYSIYFYVFISFFEPYFSGILGPVTKYYIIYLIVFLLLTSKKLQFEWFHWCFLSWFILKLVSIFWASDPYISNLHMFSHIGMIGLLLVLTTIRVEKNMIQGFIIATWVGSFFIGLLSLFFSHPYRGIVVSRQVLYLFGQEADPNNQAAFLLPGVSIALHYIFEKKKNILIGILTILVNTYVSFLTGSRGGLVGIVLISTYILASVIRSTETREKIKLFLIVVVIGVAIYFLTINFLPEVIANRIFVFSSFEGGSGRDLIWSNAWELFGSNSNFLFGAGWGSYWGHNGVFAVLHNTYLSMLCDVGIVGFLLFMLPIGIITFQLLRRKNRLPVLLLISGFIPSLFIEGINKRFFWNVLFVLLLSYKSISERTNK